MSCHHAMIYYASSTQRCTQADFYIYIYIYIYTHYTCVCVCSVCVCVCVKLCTKEFLTFLRLIPTN